MTSTDAAKSPPEERPGVDPSGSAGLGLIGWGRWFWRTLTSMRTALILLFLFALAAVPGSTFPQRLVDASAVARYYEDNPVLAEWLDRLWLFDVFRAPWFAAIYLLLFVSLIGCIVPRAGAYLRELRRDPPAPPRNLSRLPQHAAIELDGHDTVQHVADLAARLRRRRFRVATGPDWVAAEKGYLREAGNLLFHIALLGMLVAVAVGSVYGYRGNVLIIEGNGFANTVAAYDRYMPGPQVSAESLEPFSFQLDEFEVAYVLQGDRRGQVLDYTAKLTVHDSPDAPARPYTLKVNEPLNVNGTQTYLIGHGYAPTFTVHDGNGDVAFEGAVPCLTENVSTFAGECTIKVPDAKPEQLGLSVRFLPTTVELEDGTFVSAFPGALNPTAQIRAFAGDLGLSSGVPQSVYLFDSERLKKMKPLVMKAEPLQVGESIELPDGAGKVTFTGVKEWASLQIAYDPGRHAALVSAIVAIAGLVLSLTVRRRRVWVRLADGERGTTAQVGGLTRTEGGAPGFEEEFAEIVTALGAGSRGMRGNKDA
ncbi:cytochrome c biogenesis protein ResB [Thermostaphylospora chromogena]|uniref:Cytochrome c biogenesis protein n=1 Tax=Thermostaphylospora chromogena TaxID=35622 RepID=A0A1H1DGZ2_9ACTN|nr:cytochrome c biogenesis protein ResB [Thermostaphylospora chromogena]SDQ75795.1 cytochrome c biogenesis protein [Thermostaphylospora chromogena]